MTTKGTEQPDPADGPDQEPQVYHVQRELTGWKFSRRELLAAAGAATAAAALAGCGEPRVVVEEEITYQVVTNTPEATSTPASTPVPADIPLPDLDPEEMAASCSGIKAHRHRVGGMAVSPDGTLLVSGGTAEALKLWSLPQGTLVGGGEAQESVEVLVVAPDGQLVASGDGAGTIKLWSLPDLAMLKRLSGHWGGINALACSPDGTMLASGAGDSTIKLWSLPDGELLDTLEGHSEAVVALAMAPDGSMMVSGSEDGTIRLWSLPGGVLIKTLDGPQGHDAGLGVTPDGQLLVSAAAGSTFPDRGMIGFFSLPEGSLLQILPEVGEFRALAVAPDGKLLAVSQKAAIQLRSLPEGSLITELEGHTSSIKTLLITPDGRLLVSGDWEGSIRFWSLPGGEFLSCAMDLEANTEEVQGITYRLELSTGQLIEFTQPCGYPLPSGAVCTCNCVAGGLPACSCVGHSGGGHYWHPC